MGRAKGKTCMSKDRKTELLLLSTDLEMCVRAIQDIAIFDMSTEAACEKFGVDINVLRRIMGMKRADFVLTAVNINNEDYINRAFSGYEKLWLECVGLNDRKDRAIHTFDIRIVPPDCDDTMKELLKTLNKRERSICEMWCNGLTIDEIAKQYDLTRSRIQQIRAKAVRKLKSQNRYKILIYGKRLYERMITERQNYIDNAVYPDKYLEMVDEAQQFVDDKNIEALSELRKDIDNYIASINDGSTVINKDITFEELYNSIELSPPLSVRTYNCMCRANIRSLGEVANMTPGQVMRIRNLGRRSLEELTNIMNKYGLSFKDEE